MRIRHKTHLQDRDRHIAPVDPAHGVCFLDSPVGKSRLLHICFQDLLGKLPGFTVEVPVIRIRCSLAHRDDACRGRTLGSVGMQPDEHVCIGLISHLRPFRIGYIDIVCLADHQDFISFFKKRVAKLQSNIQRKLKFSDAGRNAGRPPCHFILRLGCPRSDRFLLEVSLSLMPGIDRDQKAGRLFLPALCFDLRVCFLYNTAAVRTAEHSCHAHHYCH